MRKVEFTVSMSLQGCKVSEIVEFSDEETDEEIQEHYMNWQAEQLDGGWNDID